MITKTDVSIGFYVLVETHTETHTGKHIFIITGIDNYCFWCKERDCSNMSERHYFPYRDIKKILTKQDNPEYFL